GRPQAAPAGHLTGRPQTRLVAEGGTARGPRPHHRVLPVDRPGDVSGPDAERLSRRGGGFGARPPPIWFCCGGRHLFTNCGSARPVGYKPAPPVPARGAPPLATWPRTSLVTQVPTAVLPHPARHR